MKVLHLITDLDTGGAEMMLYKLLSRMDRAAFESEVVSLTDIGPIGEKIRRLDIPVGSLGMRRGVPNPLALLRLARRLRKSRPHLIQTWMYHADLLGGLAAKLAAGIPVVWGIHNSQLDPGRSKGTTRWTAKVSGWLSGWLAVRIVYCSQVSKKVHTAAGYVANKVQVIPNGTDLEVFQPNPQARLSVRQELGVAEETPLIGLVARFHAEKDHQNFLQAASRLHAALPKVHFVLCGDGVTWKNQDLVAWTEEAGLRECCHLLGLRDDMPRLTAALDIAASSSCGEAFPLIIGEAMACGVPCVVTDVGDSAMIVGDTGRVVPPRNPAALAKAWQELIKLGMEGRRQLGEAARRRVEERFSLDKVVSQYEALYRETSQKPST